MQCRFFRVSRLFTTSAPSFAYTTDYCASVRHSQTIAPHPLRTIRFLCASLPFTSYSTPFFRPTADSCTAIHRLQPTSPSASHIHYFFAQRYVIHNFYRRIHYAHNRFLHIRMPYAMIHHSRPTMPQSFRTQHKITRRYAIHDLYAFIRFLCVGSRFTADSAPSFMNTSDSCMTVHRSQTTAPHSRTIRFLCDGRSFTAFAHTSAYYAAVVCRQCLRVGMLFTVVFDHGRYVYSCSLYCYRID